jgi:hypothetical protein
MEWDINTGQRNSSEATIKDDIAPSLLLIQCPLVALDDDITQHFFDFFDRVLFSQLS